MKQAFLLLFAATALLGIAWFLTGSTPAVSSVNINVPSEFFVNAKAGEHIPAQFYNADSNLQGLSCVGTENPHFISCAVPESYAGQQLPIELTKNGLLYVYVVDVPAE